MFVVTHMVWLPYPMIDKRDFLFNICLATFLEDKNNINFFTTENLFRVYENL